MKSPESQLILNKGVLQKKKRGWSTGDLQYKRPDCDLAMKSIDTISFHQKF